MRIIELQGHRNAGKTSTMLILYTILLQNGFVRVGGQLHFPPKPDFDVLLERDGKKYGFMTFGDKLKDLKKFLSDFDKKHKCELVFTASRQFKTWRIKDDYEETSTIWKSRQPDGSANVEILEANLASALALFARL